VPDIWLKLMYHKKDVANGVYRDNPEAELWALEELLDDPYGAGSWLNRRRTRVFEKRVCPRWRSGVRGPGPVPVDKRYEVGMRRALAELAAEIDNFTPGQAKAALGKISPPPHPVRSLVKSHGLRNVDIARAYGCKPGFVSQALSGRVAMPDRLMMLILNLLENSKSQSAIET
jgi:hypothetical protein